MTNDTRRYRVQTETGEQVFGADLERGNAYLTAYGATVLGGAPIDDLLVDEFTFREYALSGQRPTTYVVVRTA
jgi:hypothetical protein